MTQPDRPVRCPRPDDVADQATLDYLLDVGVSPERVADLGAGGDARDALAEHRLMGDAVRTSARELARELGVELSSVEQFLSAAGLPAADLDAPIVTPQETDVLRAYFTAAELFTAEPALRFLRVLSGSVARVAEAAISMFQLNVEDPLVASGGTQLERTRASDEALMLLRYVPELFTSLFPRMALDATRRLSAGQASAPSHDRLLMTVGFADLVGSTQLARNRGPAELAAILVAFERLAHEAMVGQARVVKSIGDEVMFVTSNAADACRSALQLTDAVEADPDLPGLRVGLAMGPTIALDGDFYGEEVNRASRLVRVAEPCAVVATTTVAQRSASDADLRFEALGPRTLVGFTEPADVVAVEWRARTERSADGAVEASEAPDRNGSVTMAANDWSEPSC